MYKITIEKIERKEGFDSEYEKLADTGNERDKGAVYGYVKRPVIKNDVVEVFSQRTEPENEAEWMTNVIKAVNGIQ